MMLKLRLLILTICCIVFHLVIVLFLLPVRLCMVIFLVSPPTRSKLLISSIRVRLLLIACLLRSVRSITTIGSVGSLIFCPVILFVTFYLIKRRL